MTRATLLVLLLVAPLFLSACATVNGIGRDLSSAGNAISNATR